MAREEIYGIRDLSFSKWHRAIPDDDLTMIDIDCVEYCRSCRRAIAMIETAIDVGQEYKCTEVMRRLAYQAKEIPAYLVFYTMEPTPRFRVSKVSYPKVDMEVYDEQKMIAFLKNLHSACPCRACHAA